MRLRHALLIVLVSILGPSSSAAQSPSASSPMAMIDGVNVSAEDVWRRWRMDSPAEFERVRRDTYEGERRALDAILSERLLAAEARARGLTPDALLEAETDKRVREVDERDVSTFLTSTSAPP